MILTLRFIVLFVLCWLCFVAAPRPWRALTLAFWGAVFYAMFAGAFPVLNILNIMHLATPQSAILSAVIFNALIIIALIPLALRGVKYRPAGAAVLLRQNLLIYGLGGLVAPFIGIKLIDMVITYLHFA